MSFYGSIYYQAGEAITKIFVQNFGKNKTEFLEGDIKDEVAIQADGRKGNFYLNAGNRWITLNGDAETNVCTVYHNSPDETNLSTYLVPITKVANVPAGTSVQELPLSDDIYFSTPAIYYDEAGHVIPTGNVMYFKIPKIEIQAGIDDLNVAVGSLQEIAADHETRVTKNTTDIENTTLDVGKLEKNVGTNLATITSKNRTIMDIIGNADDMDSEVDKSNMAADVSQKTLSGYVGHLYSLYNTYNKDLKDLLADVRDIERRLNAGGL